MTNGYLERNHGCVELDAIFGAAPKTVAPWPRLGHSKRGPRMPSVGELFTQPPTLGLLDPRELWATQTWVVRHHAAYYLSGVWERTGRTSADQSVLTNRYPLIIADGRGRLAILAGHHRCLAALIEGRPVIVRIAPTSADSPVAVLPLLTTGRHMTGVSAAEAGPRSSASAAVAYQADEYPAATERTDEANAYPEATGALQLIGQRQRAHVDDHTELVRTLGLLGLDDIEITDRLAVAGLTTVTPVERTSR